MGNPWRSPQEETEDYPGMVVDDGRVSGSITAGRSRLPLWCLTAGVQEGWHHVEKNYSPSRYGLDGSKFFDFLHDLLEARGELGRLLCILADVQRQEDERDDLVIEPPWWEDEASKQRVIKQLKRCVEVLEEKS